MDTTTAMQDIAIRRLERKGFRVNRIVTFDLDDAPTVMLSRRRGCSIHLCQVEPDGSTHGYYEWPSPKTKTKEPNHE